MKHFKKTKKLVEGKSFDRQEREKINDITSDLNDQQREKESENQLKPSGEQGDQQIRAPINPDGSPISIDDIKDRQPEKGIEGIGGTPPSSIGIGTHGNKKRSGIFSKLYRGASTLDSLSQVMKKGAPVLPVAEDLYEDEEGKLRRFGKITTGISGSNPYYFEFDHYDKGSDQNLVLYGIAPGSNTPGADLQPIQLKVKAIVPRDKMDVRPMTAPTDANVQSNFVSEVKYTPPPLSSLGGSRTGGGKGKGGSSGTEVVSGKAGDNAETTSYAVDGLSYDGQGGVRDEGSGRFAPGNQSGVHFAKGGNAEKNEIEAVTNNAVAVIGKQVPSLKEVMRGGSSFGYSSSSDDGDDSGGGSSGGGGWYGGSGGGGGFTTIRRQYRPNHKKRDSDQVNIPKNLWYHPAIQSMIKRMIATDKGKKRIKIGSYYGMLVRSDPGDGDSRLKLVRKIPRSHIPKVFLDDDFIAEILEIVPIPPNLGGPGIAAAAVPALGYVVSQTTGLSLNASKGSAMAAIAQTGERLNITGKPSPLELPGRASGGNEISISPPSTTPIGLPLKENKKLSSLIQGVELNENFAEWLGSAVGSGVKITRDMAEKTKQAIKSAVSGFEKSSGVKLNKIDYQNILSGIAYDIKHPMGGDYEQPEWSGDIKGGPDDVDLDPDNNVDFVGGGRPDPEGRPEEPTPEPTPGTTPEPTPEPEGEPKEPLRKYPKTPAERHKDTIDWARSFKYVREPVDRWGIPFPDETIEQLESLDIQAIEFEKSVTKEMVIQELIDAWHAAKEKPTTKVMLQGTEYVPYEDAVKAREVEYSFKDPAPHFQAEREADFQKKHQELNQFWDDRNTYTRKSPFADHGSYGYQYREKHMEFNRDTPEGAEWQENYLKYIKGEILKTKTLELFPEYKPTVKEGGVLQQLANMVWEQNKVNILAPDYKLNMNHFDPQPDSNMYDFSDIDDTGKLIPKTKIHNRRNRRRDGLKTFKESFDSIRKLVTGN